MHEAALAATVASAIRSAEVRSRRLRLIVAGGHDDPDVFDSALRQHLAVELGQTDDLVIEIVHEPVERLCAACAATFMASRPDDACPSCGGPGLLSAGRERVELEWLATVPVAGGAVAVGSEDH